MNNLANPQLLVIQKVSSVITRERDVQALLESVLSILESDMGMIRGTFALLYGDTLKIEVSCGLAETEKKLGHYRIGEGITGHVAETGHSHVIPDPEHHVYTVGDCTTGASLVVRAMANARDAVREIIRDLT